MPTCFVIMPYGGNDEIKQRRYRGVYNGILARAAREAGYEPKRSDLAANPGHINADFVRDLANADIVVADLSEYNANVFLELGIRFTLRKSGTVLVMDKEYAESIPFDVRNYQVITYSPTDLADVEEAVAKIVSGIKKRESEPNKSDNLVHDILPWLPHVMREGARDESSERIEALHKELETLRSENSKLETELRRVKPEWTRDDGLPGDIDIDEILNEADAIRASSGENARLRLHTAIEEGGEQGFVRELREILRSPYLTPIDFQAISRMCDQLGLDDHGRATLEIGRARYPEHVDMMLSLAHDYSSSPNRDLRVRGRRMVEDYLTVEHTPDGPKLSRRPPGEYRQAAAALFNVYLNENQYDWVISIADSLEETVGSDVLFARNKARALHKLRLNDEAEAAFKYAIGIDSVDDTLHAFYADFLDDLGRFADAYQEFELAICGDPNDGNRFVNLANHIMLRGVYRDANDALVGPISGRQQRLRLAMPLYLKGIEISPERRRNVISAMVNYEQITEAQELHEGRLPTGQYDTGPLEYVMKLIEVGA